MHNGGVKTILILVALMVVQIAFAESASSLYDVPLKDIDGK